MATKTVTKMKTYTVTMQVIAPANYTAEHIEELVTDRIDDGVSVGGERQEALDITGITASAN